MGKIFIAFARRLTMTSNFQRSVTSYVAAFALVAGLTAAKPAEGSRNVVAAKNINRLDHGALASPVFPIVRFPLPQGAPLAVTQATYWNAFWEVVEWCAGHPKSCKYLLEKIAEQTAERCAVLDRLIEMAGRQQVIDIDKAGRGEIIAGLEYVKKLAKCQSS
jgi:hypothetical protein